MPKYAALIYTPEDLENEPPPDVWQQVIQDYFEFGENAGERIIGGEALLPTNTARCVHVEAKGGEPIVTDGPFAETEEVLGGFYLLDVENEEEAIRWAAQIPGAWNGRIEVRPIMEVTPSPE